MGMKQSPGSKRLQRLQELDIYIYIYILYILIFDTRIGYYIVFVPSDTVLNQVVKFSNLGWDVLTFLEKVCEYLSKVVNSR